MTQRYIVMRESDGDVHIRTTLSTELLKSEIVGERIQKVREYRTVWKVGRKLRLK